MLVDGSLLVQVRPAGNTSIYTALRRTSITRLVICNTSAANGTFSLFHDDNGNTFDVTTALYFNHPIAANETLIVEADSMSSGFMVKTDGQLGFEAALGVTVSLYGVVENVR